MDGSEFDLSNHDIFPGPPHDTTGGGDADHPQSSCSMDSFFDEILKDTHACTHTHTCNPPGPDLSHTHTCFHVHTKILSSAPPPSSSAAADDATTTAESSGGKSCADTTTPPASAGGGKKRPCGNREAVRKYREKKKALAASLEDENRQLREENRALQRKVQALAAMETENMRLKCLLVDLRGRIDGEIGVFPYQKQQVRTPGMEMATAAAATAVGGVGQVTMAGVGGGAQVLSSCGLPCDDQTYCTRTPLMQGRVGAEDTGLPAADRFGGICDFRTIPCFGNSRGTGQKDFMGCVRADSTPSACISTVSEKNGTSSTGC